VSCRATALAAAKNSLKVPERGSGASRGCVPRKHTLALVFYRALYRSAGDRVWLAIRFTKQGRTSWRGAISARLIVVALLFLQNLNDWPHWASSYDTQSSYGILFARKIIMGLLFSVAFPR